MLQIKRTSSLVLTLSGIPKTIMLLCIDMVVYHTPITPLQALGFGISAAGTYHYSKIGALKPQHVPQSHLNDNRDEESRLVDY